MNISRYKKVAPYITILIGILLFIYGYALLQDTGSRRESSVFFIAGVLFTITGIVLHGYKGVGTRLFTLLTWLTTIVSAYTVLHAIVYFISPFYVVEQALGQEKYYNIFAAIGFNLGLIIYMLITQKQLVDKAAEYRRHVSLLGLILMIVASAPYSLRAIQILT